MPLKHNLSVYDAKEILLGIYSYYHKQQSIGNVTKTRHIREGLKALNLYIRILDYYYSLYEFYPEIVDTDKILEKINITETQILKVYEYFKQVSYSINPIHYD